MSRLSLKTVAIALVLTVAFVGCGKKEEPAAPATPGAPATPAQPAAEPAAPAAKPGAAIALEMGAVFPLTGSVATYGDEARKGVLLAAEEARAAGAVMPTVTIVDNEGKQQATVTAVNKFLDIDKVPVLIGAIKSNNTMQAGDRAEAARAPLVTPASTNVDITAGKKYVFRVCFTDEFQGTAAANFAYDTLGARRAAVMVSSSETYSKGLGEVFTRVFKQRGGQIVSQMSFTSDADDFSGQIALLKPKSPEVVFLPAYYEAAAKCISQARATGLRSTFVGTDGWDSPKLYDLSGGVVKGNYFTTHFSPEEDRPVVKQFVQDYKAAYNDAPGAIAALSYDAAMLVFDAARRAGSTDRQAITDALATTKDFEGVTGTFSMDENHNPVKPLVVLETTDTGAKFKEVINP